MLKSNVVELASAKKGIHDKTLKTFKAKTNCFNQPYVTDSSKLLKIDELSEFSRK